jgi:hypothetical protein
MFRRILLAMLAIVLVVIGGTILTGAGLIWTTFGADGGVTTSAGNVTGGASSEAIVVDVAKVAVSVPFLPIAGQTSVVVTPAGSAGSTGLFVAIAPTPVVDEYLSGGRYSVGEYSDGTWRTVDVPGFRELAPTITAPWTSSDEGLSPSIALGSGGTQSIVIMNSDGGAPVDTLLTLRMRVPDTSTYAIVLTAVGAIVVGSGLVLLWVAVRHLRRRGSHE